MLRPHAGKAIGLQFNAHRHLVVFHITQALTQGLRLFADAKQVLHVMTYFMGDDIGAREIATGLKAFGHFVEKGHVEIDLGVARTIERPQRSLTGATGGRGLTAIEHQTRLHIGAAHLLEDLAPGGLGRQGTQKKTFIAGIRGTTVSGATVVASASGQLGVQSSSRRYKQDIVDMGVASDALLKLRPVTFRYKQADEAGEHPLQYGLIAEEVAEVMPELVVRDEQGQPETVAYQTLSSLLLNEYQKQQRDMRALADTARAQQRAAQERVVNLERKLESRDRELVALHEELVRLAQVTRQLQAALPTAQPLAVREP